MSFDDGDEVLEAAAVTDRRVPPGMLRCEYTVTFLTPYLRMPDARPPVVPKFEMAFDCDVDDLRDLRVARRLVFDDRTAITQPMGSAPVDGVDR
jgi:hypothetical protein